MWIETMDKTRSANMLGPAENEVVETPAGQRSDADSFAAAVEDVGEGSVLGYRLHQQGVLSDFGLNVLKPIGADELLDNAAKAAADGMQATLAKVLEYRPEHNDLLFRSGVGWRPGVIGIASLPADAMSPAGFAFRNGAPVISNHLENEKRFSTPPVMAEHGVRRAINVLVSRGSGAWGVLEVDSSNAGRFEAADLAFLQGLANFIGVALDRLAAEAKLLASIEHQKLLVREASHRVKNSLAMLSGLMRMQARSAGEGSASQALEQASDRIIAVARTHDRIWRQSAADTVDLADLLSDLCEALASQWPHVRFDCTAQSHVLPTNQAASFALLVNELATNAAKHGYDAQGGPISIELTSGPDGGTLVVADQGAGLPDDFNLEKTSSESLGMRLITTLARSIGGEIMAQSGQGAVFTITGF